jgi:hypothetical protein
MVCGLCGASCTMHIKSIQKRVLDNHTLQLELYGETESEWRQSADWLSSPHECPIYLCLDALFFSTIPSSTVYGTI